MKVFELMSILSECKAGQVVYVTAHPAGTQNELEAVNNDGEIIFLSGDGRYDDDLKSLDTEVG